MFAFLTKIFGSRNDRMLKQYRKIVNQINQLEPKYEALDDAALQAKTAEFRAQLAAGKTLDDILPEAFATVREASKRTLGLRHFDVQLIGGMGLHHGKISEMRTGEGKTLTSTLAVYLNALEGRGVHVVTVNDYLASRDAETLRPLYEFLGLSVGVNLPHIEREAKQAAYAADVTYGTNNEYGFDYLRDNMVYEAAERVQRGLNFAIVDEVDSILIDEARTPLIISGQASDHTDIYQAINRIAPKLDRQEGEADPRTGLGVTKPGDFTVDEKSHQVHLTESGYEKAEALLNGAGLLAEGESLYAAGNIRLIHHLYAALRAHHIYHRDQHYVVQKGEVVIVDEFTGRLMNGRRWSDGLHQAVEAKEGVAIQPENQTMASITFQNYFRLYSKLAGMTGTADTEAFEFQSIYGLETLIVPPNKPSQRIDQNDRIYKTTREKYNAAIADIAECHERGQPVLVGTTSIENSEAISKLLTEHKLPHQVLNAKQHEREADIIAQAGRQGAITIATNMAGRGTDIVLGGNIAKELAAIAADDTIGQTERAARVQQLRTMWQAEHEKVKALGGLRIIATERHESRRIDNQLRGRSGRQGDPGSSRFYLGLDDQLLRIFAGERLRMVMDKLNMPEGEAIEAGMVTRSIEGAQRKVEARNFDMRKQLLEYDDVANEQRKVIYQLRNTMLDEGDLSTMLTNMRRECVAELVRRFVPEQSMEEQWDIPALEKALAEWDVSVPNLAALAAQDGTDDEAIVAAAQSAADAAYAAKVELVGAAQFAPFERAVLLQTLDKSWRDHLASLDHLRQGIHLRGYAQKQPKQEYKREAFELFSQLIDAVKTEVTRLLLTVRIQQPEAAAAAAEQINERAAHIPEMQLHGAPNTSSEDAPSTRPNTPPAAAHVGRNDPCPCGSGKKFKNCHGKLS